MGLHLETGGSLALLHGAGSTKDLIRTSIHHEYDSPCGIGAVPSEVRLTAPMPWGEIVFMIITRRD